MARPGSRGCVCCARAALSPSPNVVPDHVYKGAPDVLKYQWKLMVLVSGKTPGMWRQAGG